MSSSRLNVILDILYYRNVVCLECLGEGGSESSVQLSSVSETCCGTKLRDLVVHQPQLISSCPMSTCRVIPSPLRLEMISCG